jgi:WD40 repeat protein
MSELLEDQKNFRKLRKVLRQIEHLHLLPRHLNREEESKVLKRKFYRDQLEALSLKYKDQHEWLQDTSSSVVQQNEEDSTFEIGSSQESLVIKVTNEESIVINDEDIHEEVEEISKLEEPTAPEKQPKNERDSSKILNEVTQKLDDLVLDSAKKQPILRPKETSQKPVKPKQTQVLLKVPKVSYNSTLVADAHEDLIVCLDICTESMLIVTGSRDTTIKVWELETGGLVHSFGGHSKSLTNVQFWSYDNYLKVLQSKDSDDDEEDAKDDPKKEPLILSSSLDCTLRLWSLLKGQCIQQFYLYNPINYFDTQGTQFLVGLEAGKVEYWNNMKLVCTSKMFTDSDSVGVIRFFSNQAKFFVLASNGKAKMAAIDAQSETLNCLREVDLYKVLVKGDSSKSGQIIQNFKSFEILSETKILVINDNQSFVILYDFSDEQETTFKLISTNSSSYGFTNCFCKLGQQFLISSYTIDDASNAINVFESNSQSFEYQYSLQDNEGKDETQTYCFSTLAAKKLSSHETVIVSGSRRSFKIWAISEDNSKAHPAKIMKMSQNASLTSNIDRSDNEEEETDESDDENEEEEVEEEEEEKEDSSPKKSNCLIQ